ASPERWVGVPARRVQVADEARRIAPGRINQGVEVLSVHQLDHGGPQLLAEGLAAAASRGFPRHLVRALAAFEALLNRGVEPPRFDDVLERMHRRLVAEAGEIMVQVVLELIAAAGLGA